MVVVSLSVLHFQSHDHDDHPLKAKKAGSDEKAGFLELHLVDGVKLALYTTAGSLSLQDSFLLVILVWQEPHFQKNLKKQ